MAKRTRSVLLAALVLALAATFPSPAFTQDCVESDQGGCLPTAPDSERVDLAKPSFSDPTNVTNLLFPISQLHSALILGHIEADPLRIEVTLLPETRTVDFDGQPVEVLVSQFVAFVDGRLHEVALDLYAQADDGSVWYFGEDVYNYEDGAIADTEGTWHAGVDGPAAMIMPGDPQVGDVYRTENIPGLVFEEVTVTSTDVTVDGPQGPVEGAIVVQELHQDGELEDKTFAPGYGEFLSASDTDLEALALAVPTDALADPPPADLQALTSGAADILDAVQADDHEAAASAFDAMTAAWEAYQAGDVPPLIESQMTAALAALGEAVEAADPAETGQAAIGVAHASLSLELRFRQPAEIDLARFDLWTRQLVLDAGIEDSAAVGGDVISMEWVWDRVSHSVDPSTAEYVDDQLTRLRVAAELEDIESASAIATQLHDFLDGVQVTA
jgi:hypothetical protein